MSIASVHRPSIFLRFLHRTSGCRASPQPVLCATQSGNQRWDGRRQRRRLAPTTHSTTTGRTGSDGQRSPGEMRAMSGGCEDLSSLPIRSATQYRAACRSDSVAGRQRPEIMQLEKLRFHARKNARKKVPCASFRTAGTETLLRHNLRCTVTGRAN